MRGSGGFWIAMGTVITEAFITIFIKKRQLFMFLCAVCFYRAGVLPDRTQEFIELYFVIIVFAFLVACLSHSSFKIQNFALRILQGIRGYSSKKRGD